MPQFAAWAATTAANAVAAWGANAAFQAVVYATVYATTTIATTIAVQQLGQALMGGQATDPETGKQSLKQTIPPRIRGYGRRRIGGSFMLWVAKANYAYDVVATHHGRIEAVEQIWLHDEVVGWVAGDGGGAGAWVQGTERYGGGGGNNGTGGDLIHVAWRLGLETETAYPAIVSALSGDGVWTSAHRGDGIASIGVDYHHAKLENFGSDFPLGAEPQWGMTARLSPIWDPRDEGQDREDATTWSAKRNAALVILDLLCRADGMGEDFATAVEPELAHWMGEADICDEAVPLKAGGTEPRYTIDGFYSLTEDPQEALNKALLACDGRLCRTEAGVWKLWVGKFRAPTVVLTAADLTGEYDIAGDDPEQEAITTLIPAYVSEPHKWSMVDAEPWSGDDALQREGNRTQPFPLEWVTRFSQARRLAKREHSRQRAPLRGQINGKLSCARAMGERWVSVELDLFDDPIAIELLQGTRTAFSRATVEMPFVQADPDVDDWDPATEEGTPPPVGTEVDPGPAYVAAPTKLTATYNDGKVDLVVGLPAGTSATYALVLMATDSDDPNEANPVTGELVGAAGSEVTDSVTVPSGTQRFWAQAYNGVGGASILLGPRLVNVP